MDSLRWIELAGEFLESRAQDVVTLRRALRIFLTAATNTTLPDPDTLLHRIRRHGNPPHAENVGRHVAPAFLATARGGSGSGGGRRPRAEDLPIRGSLLTLLESEDPSFRGEVAAGLCSLAHDVMPRVPGVAVEVLEPIMAVAVADPDGGVRIRALEGAEKVLRRSAALGLLGSALPLPWRAWLESPSALEDAAHPRHRLLWRGLRAIVAGEAEGEVGWRGVLAPSIECGPAAMLGPVIEGAWERCRRAWRAGGGAEEAPAARLRGVARQCGGCLARGIWAARYGAHFGSAADRRSESFRSARALFHALMLFGDASEGLLVAEEVELWRRSVLHAAESASAGDMRKEEELGAVLNLLGNEGGVLSAITLSGDTKRLGAELAPALASALSQARTWEWPSVFHWASRSTESTQQTVLVTVAMPKGDSWRHSRPPSLRGRCDEPALVELREGATVRWRGMATLEWVDEDDVWRGRVSIERKTRGKSLEGRVGMLSSDAWPPVQGSGAAEAGWAAPTLRDVVEEGPDSAGSVAWERRVDPIVKGWGFVLWL